MFTALSCPIFLHTQGFTQHIGIDFSHIIFHLWSKLCISMPCETIGAFNTLKNSYFFVKWEKTLQMEMWRITVVVFQFFPQFDHRFDNLILMSFFSTSLLFKTHLIYKNLPLHCSVTCKPQTFNDLH